MSHISIDDASDLSRKAVDLYASASERSQTFGAWVLTTFFPEVWPESLVSGRDFYHAVRTEDARLYLVGMLRSGCLSAAVLREELLLAQV